ncbi:MAG TPA: dihydroneopterin aldolase [Chloroflexi bacterium]|nr:dihydroneopterin aldolase [Chloroflexota bacterium]
MDQVFIRDLWVRGIIGVYDWERQQAQDILINIVVQVDLRQAGHTDDLRDCIDYEALSKKVIAHTESVQRQTVEALANDLAQICLAEPGAESATVRVEKPGAVQSAKSVGVEIYRNREV